MESPVPFFYRHVFTSAALAGLLMASPASFGSGEAATGEPLRVLETGSTLLYPLFNLWVPAYAKAHPSVQITTQGTGSGTGISEALSGVAQIGASDAYMSNPMVKAHPDVLNIPLAISSQMVNYNIPGLEQRAAQAERTRRSPGSTTARSATGTTRRSPRTTRA